MIDFSSMSEDELRALSVKANEHLFALAQKRQSEAEAEKEIKTRAANSRLSDIKLELDRLFKEVNDICKEFDYNDDVGFYYSAPNDVSIQYSAGDGWYSSY